MLRLEATSLKPLSSTAVSERIRAGFNGKMAENDWMKSGSAMIPFLDELKLQRRLEEDQLNIK